MLSGPTSVLRPAERDAAYQLALDLSLRTPEAVYQNPQELAKAGGGRMTALRIVLWVAPMWHRTML